MIGVVRTSNIELPTSNIVFCQFKNTQQSELTFHNFPNQYIAVYLFKMAFFLMGLLNNVIPFSLIAWGQLTVETGLTSIFSQTVAR